MNNGESPLLYYTTDREKLIMPLQKMSQSKPLHMVAQKKSDLEEKGVGAYDSLANRSVKNLHSHSFCHSVNEYTLRFILCAYLLEFSTQ